MAYKIYSGTNSPILVKITNVKDELIGPTAMAAATRWRLKYICATGEDAVFADSDVVAHADVFDATTYASTSELIIDLGPLDLTAGNDPSAELWMYSAAFPLGRIIAQLNITISDEAGSGTTAGVRYIPRTITATEELVLGDFYRRSIRYNSTSAGTLTFPVMTEAYNGEKIKFIIENTGDLTLACQGDTTIINGTITGITGTTQYGSITLEYDYALDVLTVDKSYGKWDE